MAMPENREKHVRFENLKSMEPGSPCVWAIGGGKGGVGKSMLSSSIGVAIAETGQTCTVVDVDLGEERAGVAVHPQQVAELAQPGRVVAGRAALGDAHAVDAAVAE